MSCCTNGRSKRLNRSIFRLGCGRGWAEASTSSIVFARWRQCTLICGHIGATWQIRLNLCLFRPTRVHNPNGKLIGSTAFGRPLVKRFALCYEIVVCLSGLSVLSVCLSVCPVCDFGVLWPNGGMDQDETWYGGRSRPRPHCVTWGPSSPSPKTGRAPNFQSMSVVAKRLDGLMCNLGHSTPLPNFGPCIVAKRLNGSRCHLVRE